ncbi:acyl-CoA thioesterase [Oceaniferula spumae]
MKTHRLVMPGDLNQYGFLFGGKMLSWIDEACWIAATLDFPGRRFVTIGMDKVEFHHGVREGVILEINCQRVKMGTTSLSYQVSVIRGSGDDKTEIFSTCVSFVNVDAEGNKQPIAQ